MGDDKPEPLQVWLVNPPIQDPWRTRQEYIDDQKRSRRLAVVAIISILLSALATVGTFVGALATLRSSQPAGAWVLWIRQGIPPDGWWSTHDAYLRMDECSARVEQLGREYERDGYSVARWGSKSLSYMKGSGGTDNYLTCLPDAVDPREPRARR